MYILDNILRWYKEFNSVRTTFYREKSVFDGLLPASTGMGGNNPARAALMAGAIAMRLMNDEITVKEVPSPLQCPACDYGSSFSRAVEIFNPDYRRLFVSGTASIDPSGKTAHVGDVDAQISLILEIVEAILKSCGKSVCWRFISLLRRNEQHVKIICQKEEAQQKKKTFTIWSNCEKNRLLPEYRPI